MLLLDYARRFTPTTPTYVYGMPFTLASSLMYARDLLKGKKCEQRDLLKRK